jgi:hypothetical protein
MRRNGAVCGKVTAAWRGSCSVRKIPSYILLKGLNIFLQDQRNNSGGNSGDQQPSISDIRATPDG